jgi:hypothetical protein
MACRTVTLRLLTTTGPLVCRPHHQAIAGWVSIAPCASQTGEHGSVCGSNGPLYFAQHLRGGARFFILARGALYDEHDRQLRQRQGTNDLNAKRALMDEGPFG